MTPPLKPQEQESEWLFDVQGGNFELASVERRFVQIASRAVAGGIVLACSMADLLSELTIYRYNRDKRIRERKLSQ